ncbi:MAG: metallophosphoesterase family protein, partial [Candidatus Promineifilaceae bacterium]
MKLGVLSDTHNNLGNLQKALKIFEAEGVEQLLHCGDMADMLTVRLLGGFDIIYVNGNADRSAEAVSHTLWTLNPNNEIPGDVYTGRLHGASIAATHGHLSGKLS